jgi:hypothetical protein
MFAGGGGQGGTSLFLKIFFPYTMLLTRLANDEVTPSLMVIMSIQFPLYGALIGFARYKGASAAITWLFVVHTIAVITCFLGVIPNWD